MLQVLGLEMPPPVPFEAIWEDEFLDRCANKLEQQSGNELDAKIVAVPSISPTLTAAATAFSVAEARKAIFG